MKKILHVEDEQQVIDLVKTALGSDYNIIGVTTIEKAIPLLKKDIDLVLLDLKVEKEKKIDGTLSGVKVLEKIEELGLNTKVVILSALSEQSKKIKKKHKNVKEVISKPFLVKNLRTTIKRLLK